MLKTSHPINIGKRLAASLSMFKDTSFDFRFIWKKNFLGIDVDAENDASIGGILKSILERDILK